MKADVEKIAISSGERFLGASTAYGYQTSVWFGRLRLHIFWREDPGEAFHDHPWDFWTFPLTAYVEQVLVPGTGGVYRQIVPAFRVSFRKGEHIHRILGRWNGRPRSHPQQDPGVMAGKIVTLCWRGPIARAWQYVSLKNGKVHRLPWRRYLELADRD